MTEKDYIGPDPVVWLDRLIEVNEGSAFPPKARQYINGRLRELRERVRTLCTEVKT